MSGYFLVCVRARKAWQLVGVDRDRVSAASLADTWASRGYTVKLSPAR